MNCKMFEESDMAGGTEGRWFRWECACSYVAMSPVRGTARHYAKQHLEGSVATAVLGYADRLRDLTIANLQGGPAVVWSH